MKLKPKKEVNEKGPELERANGRIGYCSGFESTADIEGNSSKVLSR